MASKAEQIPRCPECLSAVKSDYHYCPMCSASLAVSKVGETLNDLETLLVEAGPLTLNAVSQMFLILKKCAKSDPEKSHRLEERIMRKFMISIEKGEYTVQDQMNISKKIREINSLPFTREY